VGSTIDITMVLFRPDFEELRASLARLGALADEYRYLRVLISGTEDVAGAVRSLIAECGLSEVAIVEHRFDNLGFASGQNRLLEAAFQGGAEYGLVLNPDVSVDQNGIRSLAAAARSAGKRVLIGPTMRRRKDGVADDVIDTLGIAWTRSGRHYDAGAGERWSERSRFAIMPLGISGACLLVSVEAYSEIMTKCGEFFDDAFLAYREDAELGVRAGNLGINSVVVPSEKFCHTRSVRGYTRGNQLADLLGVRNRFLLRWKLGRSRPGSGGVAALRDLVVIGAALTVERRSLPGLKQAFAIRRYETNSRRVLSTTRE
jgi:GT2 family glycosyltransferase